MADRADFTPCFARESGALTSIGKNRYFKNFSWLVLEKLCRLCVSFVVAACVARYLGPSDYGLMNFAVSFTSFFTVFVTLGLDNIIARNLLRNPEQEGIILGTALWLRMAGSIVGFVLVVISVAVSSFDKQTALMVIILAAAMLFQPIGVIEPFFLSRVAGRCTTLANLCSMLVTSVLRLCLIAVKATLTAFAAVMVVEKIVLGAALYVFFKRSERHGDTWRFSYVVSKELMRDSWPLIFSGLVVMFYMRIDQIMIKEMISNEALGYYSAAVYLAEGWYFLGIAASSSLFPAIIKAREISTELYYQRLQSYYRLMAWMAISVAVPVHFLADKLILLLYGSAYQPAAEVLKVNIWTGVFVFLGVASSSWLVAENLQRVALIRTLVGALINVILNLVLIPKYGIVGSAWATLIAQAFASYLVYSFRKITFRTFMMQSKALIPPIPELLRLYLNWRRT